MYIYVNIYICVSHIHVSVFIHARTFVCMYIYKFLHVFIFTYTYNTFARVSRVNIQILLARLFWSVVCVCLIGWNVMCVEGRDGGGIVCVCSNREFDLCLYTRISERLWPVVHMCTHI